MTTSARLGIAVSALLSLALPAVMLSGCGGSSSPNQIGGGAFIVLKTEPANNGRIFLNQSLRIFFSNPVDLDTANFNSIAFFVRNANGDSLAEQVVGRFRHGTDEDGATDRKILEFVPKLPSNDTYTDGGFRPARRYFVSLVGATNRASPTVRDDAGRSVSINSPVQSLSFQTASGTTPQELFLDTQIGGPRVSSIRVGPEVGNRVSLNRLGEVPVEVVLRFNQPLNPASTNVPLRQDLDPRNFARRDKGRIYLEYDDPELGRRRWIPADVEMPDNDQTGATITMRPDGVLPNSADIRIIVEAELQDISGESNVKDASYVRTIGTFRTEDAFEAQFDAVVLDFETGALMDAEAAFRDPVATLQNGVLQASFEFEGLQTPFDYGPTTKEIVLNTDFTTVVPKNGPPIAVTGGVFSFNNIEIPEGVTVRGVGTNPMVWLATGTVKVDGHLHVDGGDGGQVDTLNSANFPTAGGQGVCTGGNGGKGSVNVTGNTAQGENGFGPRQRPNFGGEGGRISCQGRTNNEYGAGGGGGSMATQGDPDYYNNTDPLATGKGGTGRNAQGTYDGGQPGPKVFVDERDDNDFWGRQIDAQGNVIVGELKSPVGGAGGGGGGDRTPGTANTPCTTASWINDEKGGGGAGGAGVLIVKALGAITVSAKGRISADGGRGGGGEDAGSCRQGGGGGGAAGGMVILMSATGINLVKHQGTWAAGDTNFSVSADGNLGRNTGFGRPIRLAKYPQSTGSVNAGGFGGMGVIQLMTPPGQDGDRTGNVQDDNVNILNTDLSLVTDPNEKKSFLARGDLRPDPIFMPGTFGRFSQGRTRWIATGATVRRVVTSTGAGPRATTSVPRHEPAAEDYGPDYSFAGLLTTGNTAGYLRTATDTGLYSAPLVELSSNRTRFPVSSSTPNGQKLRGGLTAHIVRVDSKLFPADGSLANYRCRLLNVAGTEVGDWRILAHTEDTLFLDAREGPLPAAVSLEILAKFFEVVTNDNEGLGDTFEVRQGNQAFRYPVANVQIGFAFHKDPSRPDISNGMDENRFPKTLDTFLWDLEDDTATGTREELRKLHFPFVKVMVRFNLNYDHQNPDTQPGPNPVGPNSARPALRFLLVPCTY